ncbi:MAG: lyase family protein [Ferroplasma sp.]|uniref:lyase family protein n=1 Tax=Ferroplasma sp. TaxID=2591003 RepID=UPI002814B4AB|nr:lyase family protein [Ferroplasma sp.]WMT51577.1 MAG: lyase family protein [Ferroplasma sp.]
MKIWSGSASPEAGNKAYRIMLEKDIEVDRHLIPYEILSLLAYNLNIYRKGIGRKEDTLKTLKELYGLYSRKLDLDPELEDVHGNIESIAMEETDGSAKNMRMFLSRNEQVHTDVDFFLVDTLIDYEKIIYSTLQEINKIRQNGIMPGYTHYRQGMPVTFQTYMDFIKNIFVYNFNKINNAIGELKELPLGYGSGFGSMSDVDFTEVASYIGMEKNIKNPLFSFMLYPDNYIMVMSIINSFLIDISRIFQDMIIFSGDEMKILELPPGYVTGSSLMPNKVNPDFMEIFQGYAAKSVSIMNLLYSGIINKTTGYHRDFQVLKDEIIPFMVELKSILGGFPDLFSGIKFNGATSEKILGNSIYATYNSKLNFNSTGNWKESYRMVGDKIKSGNRLKSYVPADVITYRDFNFIKQIVDGNTSYLETSRKRLLDTIGDIVRDIV